ncbi:MAG: trypsin-like peptidase domain-containing protein [Myxococcales bacterium]|nr:trypsin-like peptidase domain-containing protein [Myxococcales bacterium]
MFDEAVKNALLAAARDGGILDSPARVDSVARALPSGLRAERRQKRGATAQFRADLELLQALPISDDNLGVIGRYLDRAQSMASEAGVAAFLAARAGLSGGPRSFLPIDHGKQFPERVVIRDETLPIAFLARGNEAAAAVGKLEVPVHVGGVRDPAATARGTAWLLTPRHVVTCLHVLHAREPGQKASALDLAAQTAAATLSFDGASQHAATDLAAKWEDLDVAVVELAAPLAAPLPLVCRESRPPKPTPELGFFVNLIQFPRGEEKRVGLRANAALDVTSRDVFYFTDTEQGSSGAPCFDDAWQVIAVHRAWEVRNGVQYLGRTVGFANVGTLVANVLDRLRGEHPDIYAAVRRG